MLIVEFYTFVFPYYQADCLLLLSVINRIDTIKLSRRNQTESIQSRLVLLLGLSLAAY